VLTENASSSSRMMCFWFGCQPWLI
jgi:hypothetical protein